MPQPNSLAKPIIAATVEPSKEDTREKMDLALAKIVQEDPSLRVHINSKSRQTILSGISEQHLEIVADLLMREHGVAVNLGNPEVIYLETIRSMAVAEGKYIRQLGGKGNYGHVKIRLQPNEYGKGYEFSNDTRDGLVPAEYIPTIDHGLQEAMQHGVLSGSEMVDIEVSLYDGSYHEIDSNEMAFKIAAATAFKEAARKAMPVLLEPVMCVQVTVLEEYMGAIINDLNSRRGRIEDMQMLNGLQIISATAPLNTILGYPAKIRSLSYGRANCSITFKKYEVAPYPPEDDWQAPVRVK